VAKVLILDDDKSDTGELVDELALDHTVVHVRNRQELEEALRQGPFSIILVDLMMALEDGIPANESDTGFSAGAYLYEKLVAPVFPDVPFLIITGVDTRTELFGRAVRRLAGYAGYRGCLEKPVDAEDVMKALGSAAERRQGEDG
jgi:CheY-like chemotaxis protein